MRLAIVCSTLFLASGVVVTATSLLQDPEILIDTGGDAIPISTGINQVQPTGAATVTYDFLNDTASIVTSLTFQTTINTGLSSAAAASFTCANPGGYFMNCNTTYTSSTGNLLYLFSGVNPSDGDEFVGGDPENGEQEGIPPGGQFIITLQGWTPNATSAGEMLYSDIPTLNNGFTTDAPEPAVALTLGTGFLLFAAVWRRRRTVRQSLRSGFRFERLHHRKEFRPLAKRL